MSRAGSRKEQERRARRKTASQAPATRDESELTALHEAGHVVVAHALGRRVVYARSKPVRLPAGHPHNPTSGPMISLGFHLAEPLRAKEVNAQHEAGRPLTDSQREWLLGEAVITLAGPGVESSLGDRHTMLESAASDFQQFGQIAGLLGRTEEKGDDTIVEPAFHQAVLTVGHSIVAEYASTVVEVADALRANSEMDASQLEAVLAGVQRGSHAYLLETLR